MPTSPVRGRRTAVLLGTLCAALLPPLAACSGSDDVAPSTTAAPTTTAAPSATAPSTTAPPTPEQGVEAAYLAITARYYDRLADPTETGAPLEDDLVDSALAKVKDTLGELASIGERFTFTARGKPTPNIWRIEISGSSAVLTNCLIDDIVRIGPDGGVLNDSTASSLLRTSLREVKGAWKVSDQKVVNKWQDGLGCDR